MDVMDDNPLRDAIMRRAAQVLKPQGNSPKQTLLENRAYWFEAGMRYATGGGLVHFPNEQMICALAVEICVLEKKLREKKNG